MKLNVCRRHGYVKLAHYSLRKFVGERHLGFLIRLWFPLSGHLKHDYLIKYAHFVKSYLARFAFISDPEK